MAIFLQLELELHKRRLVYFVSCYIPEVEEHLVYSRCQLKCVGRKVGKFLLLSIWKHSLFNGIPKAHGFCTTEHVHSTATNYIPYLMCAIL